MSSCFSEQWEMVESWQEWTQCCTTYICLSAEWLNSFSKKKLQCFSNLCRLLQTALWYASSRYWKHSLHKCLQATNCYSQAATWYFSAERGYDARIALPNVVGCFKDKSLSNPVIENTIQRMGGKVLPNTSADLLLMKHSSAPHCYLVVDNQQSLNSAIKAALPKSKLNNNNMRLQKYAQGGWNIFSSNYIKRCIKLTRNEESLFVNPMDIILKLLDGYTTKSYARPHKPLLLR